MNPKYGAGLLIAAYFVFGMAWNNPMEILPNFQNVKDTTVCHRTCVKRPDGYMECTTTCTRTSVDSAAPTKATNAPVGGSTGPKLPTTTVNPALQGNVLQKGTVGGSTGTTKPTLPTTGRHQ